MATTTNLEMYKRDDKTFRLVVTQGGTNLVITGDTVVFTVKSIAKDLVAKIIKSSANAGEVTILPSPNDHKAEVFITPADTSSLDVGIYTWDAQLTITATGKVHTIASGIFRLKQDVTF